MILKVDINKVLVTVQMDGTDDINYPFSLRLQLVDSPGRQDIRFLQRVRM